MSTSSPTESTNAFLALSRGQMSGQADYSPSRILVSAPSTGMTSNVKTEEQDIDVTDAERALFGAKRPRGRPPGSGKKLKSIEGRSQHPATLRKHAQLDRMGQFEKQVESAKQADRQAKSVALRALRKTPDYQNASDDHQAVMRAATIENLVQNRTRKGITASQKLADLAQKLEDAGVFVHLDARKLTHTGRDEVKQAEADGWVDMGDLRTFDPDSITDVGDWTDLTIGMQSLTTEEEIDFAGSMQAQTENERTTYVGLLWKITLKEWRDRIKKTQKIVEDLDNEGPIYQKAAANDLKPHQIFSKPLRAVLRNQWSRQELTADQGWYHSPIQCEDGKWTGFPGSESKWNVKYLKKHGFLPDQSLSANYEYAFQMIVNGDESKPPKDWQEMLPQDVDSLIWGAEESGEWLSTDAEGDVDMLG